MHEARYSVRWLLSFDDGGAAGLSAEDGWDGLNETRGVKYGKYG
uniref:Uncharacterized protein n=1 Tax=Utricularia reniformis TaxID=192314 RepID=A0A1Y0B0M1_9LAMI|nr:hypothetical protein AEK19_MT0678 [Utricularia reniformis]ART30927.1 hypothetical protein AEK19_MT0678 [Utricularia reniformis]